MRGAGRRLRSAGRGPRDAGTQAVGRGPRATGRGPRAAGRGGAPEMLDRRKGICRQRAIAYENQNPTKEVGN